VSRVASSGLPIYGRTDGRTCESASKNRVGVGIYETAEAEDPPGIYPPLCVP